MSQIDLEGLYDLFVLITINLATVQIHFSFSWTNENYTFNYLPVNVIIINLLENCRKI
jgi:hypothetical protein